VKRVYLLSCEPVPSEVRTTSARLSEIPRTHSNIELPQHSPRTEETLSSTHTTSRPSLCRPTSPRASPPQPLAALTHVHHRHLRTRLFPRSLSHLRP
jgi:hypothetical protein